MKNSMTTSEGFPPDPNLVGECEKTKESAFEASSGKPVVLIVEDHSLILDALRLRLEKNNFKVITGHNYGSGVKMAQKHNPDIALLDINLPDKNGFTLAKKLDEVCSKRVKKVFITASRDETVPKLAGECGGLELIKKPFTSEELIDAVRRVAHGCPVFTNLSS